MSPFRALPPIDAATFRDLPPLAELGAHEQQLLAGMGPHEGIEGSERAKLPPLILGRSLEHGAFAVHYLVMADRQDEVLRVRVRQGEGHLMVVELTINRLAAHVPQRVVHPAHVPLESKAEAAMVGALRDARPRGG